MIFLFGLPVRFFKGLTNGSYNHSVGEAAFLIAFAGILSRILGLLRDRILASQFGAGDTLDVYYAAFRIPDLLYNLLIMGALSVAFIPVFTSLITKDEKERAWHLVNHVLSLFIVIVFGLSIFLFILTPSLVRLITPGFSLEKIELVSVFTRIMFLSPLLLGVSAILGGVLVSFKNFLLYSFAPIFYNLGIIFGALFFVDYFGEKGLAYGVVLGALLHLMIQVPAVKSLGFKFSFDFWKAWKDNGVKKVVALMIPRTMGIAVNQINLFIITIFASTLASGSLTIFNLANNLQGVPLALFGTSFATAIFPTISAMAAKGDIEGYKKIFIRTVRRILFFVLPAAMIMFVMRAQIVRVVLGSGQFTWEDTQLTLQTLGILCVSLFAQSLIPLLARSFYSFHDSKTPFYAALLGEGANIILVISLIDRWELTGLAIAFSVANLINLIFLAVVLRKRMGALEDRQNLILIFKTLLAAVGAGLATYLASRVYVQFFNIERLDTFSEVFFQLISASVAGGLIFLTLSYFLDIDEFHYFRKSLFMRIFRRPAVEESDLLEK